MELIKDIQFKPIELWSCQKNALAFSQSKPSCMLAMDMSTGKSLTALRIAADRNCNRVLIVCPNNAIEVWEEQLDEHIYNPNVFVITGTKNKKFKLLEEAFRCDQFFAIINYDSIWRSGIGNFITMNLIDKSIDIIIADECVPLNTMIETLNGPIPIQKLKKGDLVLGLNHESNKIVQTRITNCFRGLNQAERVEINDTILTWNHPIWTENRGYVPASSVLSLDTVVSIGLRCSEKEIENGIYNKMSVVWKAIREKDENIIKRKTCTFLWKKLLCKMENVTTRICKNFEYRKKNKKQQAEYVETTSKQNSYEQIKQVFELKQKSIQKSKDCKKTKSQRNGCIKRIWIQASKWWKWAAHTITTKIIISTFNVAYGICGLDGQEKWFGLSFQLQNRYSGTSTENRNRSRWAISQRHKDGIERREKNKTLRGQGVGNNSISQQGNPKRLRRRYLKSNEDCEVYNIETETSNYFANNLLVHNSHRIKSYDSKVSSFFEKLYCLCDNRIGLTGTPFHNSPLDIFGQYRFLDPEIFGSNYFSFRNRYAIMRRLPNSNMSIVIGYKNQDELKRKFEKIAFIVDSKDVHDLPEQIFSKRLFELKGENAKGYKRLLAQKEQMKQNGCNVNDRLVMFTREQQMTSGLDIEMNEMYFDKQKALQEIFQDFEVNEPVVVLARFHHDLDMIHGAAETMERKCFEQSGRVKQLSQWRENVSSGAILAGQIQTVKESIDLCECRYPIFYSLPSSLGDYEQILKRFHRPKQKRNVTYIQLLAKGTIDEKISKALKGKKNVANYLLEDCND